MLWGERETGESAEPYTLSDLLRRPQSQLVDHREAIMQWLVDVAQIPAESILIDRKIEIMEGWPLLWTSEWKKPDLQIISADKCVLVQIEVDSGDKESTVRKLGMGLVDQLRWLRNHDTNITKCSGFYFMGSSESGHVIHVELVWRNQRLNFALQCRRLPMGSVATKVKEVMDEAQQSLESIKGQDMAGFALPMSGDFIHAQFGAGAFQMPSGHESVLIANLHTRKVYKHCLSTCDRRRLYRLERLDRKPERSVFPESSRNTFGFHTFFEFPLLKPPLSPEEARLHAKQFVESVYEAISELHVDFNLAHLDVKLGNICIDDSAGRLVAKLIDLDRSAPAGEPFRLSAACSLYTNSIMYKVRERADWTLGQLDWRQFGIMVFAFLNDIHDKLVYHSREPNPNSGFLKKLVDNGDYDSALFTSWDPKVDIL